ncbi:alpha/beta fold hydrolase [Hyphomicrobium sp. 99]|uniref:alpha/beta fold hydrolase n=1 Tax=Hyphomicrobium sp. 99 TaxID=1163419 RepID=UPI0005F87174|nr:alpha/beta hydrolase [Hyphomicrobium sp. 99]
MLGKVTANTIATQTVEAANGIRYAYRRFGNPGAVPLVLLQHFRGSMDNWDPALLDALAAEREVIAFNNVGVASTSGTTPNTVTQMARDAIVFLEALKLSEVDLLGFSLGGFVGQEVALLRPYLVRKLILAGTGPQGGPLMHGWRKDIADAVRTDQPGAQELLYIMFKQTTTSQAKGMEYLGRFMERKDRDAPGTLQTRDAQYDAVVEWGIPDHGKLQRLAAIKQPTFVANGDADLMIPPHLTHLMGGLIPNAQVKIYDDAGHGFLWQHNVEFAADVNAFLSK